MKQESSLAEQSSETQKLQIEHQQEQTRLEQARIAVELKLSKMQAELETAQAKAI